MDDSFTSWKFDRKTHTVLSIKEDDKKALPDKAFRKFQEMQLIIGLIRSGSISILGACKKHGLNPNTLKLWMTRLQVGSLTDKTHTVLSSKEDDKKALPDKAFRKFQEILRGKNSCRK